MPAPPSSSDRRGDGAVAYGPTDAVDLGCLVPGAQARRYTEAAPSGRLDVIVPCCGRIARLRGDWLHADHVVLCITCRLTYDVVVIDEYDGGFAASFVVRGEAVLARRRSGGWLAGQHP